MRLAIMLAGLIAPALILTACSGGNETKTSAAPPAPTETPEQVVRRLYAMEHPPSTPTEMQSLFTSDLAAALVPATGRSAIDWDYRFDERDAVPSNYSFTFRPRSRLTSRVVVHFQNRSVADSMFYDLCLRQDGQWRIRDIVDPDSGGVSIRPIMHLDIVRAADCPSAVPAAAVGN